MYELLLGKCIVRLKYAINEVSRSSRSRDLKIHHFSNSAIFRKNWMIFMKIDVYQFACYKKSKIVHDTFFESQNAFSLSQ